MLAVILGFSIVLPNGYGEIFTTLHSFTGTGGEGSDPIAGLIQGSDGCYYGTTDHDGDCVTANIALKRKDAGGKPSVANRLSSVF
ncbi:MAG: hypothetical protein WCN95_04185 [bacterium]